MSGARDKDIGDDENKQDKISSAKLNAKFSWMIGLLHTTKTQKICDNFSENWKWNMVLDKLPGGEVIAQES